MKNLAQVFLLAILLISVSIIANAQGYRVETESPQALTGAETFISMEGRFSISLPKQISGYTPQSANTREGRVEGSMFRWRTTHGEFLSGYIDRPEMLESISKTVLDYLRDSYISKSNGSAKIIAEKDISLEGHPGRELRVEYPDSLVISRLYLVRNRIYQATALYPVAKKAEEPQIVKILDSFKLISQADVDAEIQKRISEATPTSLPQEPVTKKLKSDAEDEGLKGKVRAVFSETENLDGTWAVSKRKPSSMAEYNERGNRIKSVQYDYRGNPMDITVYGYLDDSRVSNSKMIQYEYNPPPMVMASAPGNPKPKYDPRYHYKFKFRYDDRGNLVEKMFYDSSGKLWMRYVYNYKGNQKEELAYSENGALNQKSLSTLDDKGTEIEEINYEIKDNSIRSKYSYSYEFDSHGNWIKQTVSKWVTKDGKSQYEPHSVTYRTVSYY